jgi:hypothetical protein
VPVPVTGTNFVDGMTAEWKNAAAPVGTPVAAGPVQKNPGPPLSWTVTLVPGAVGKDTLTLVSPIGLRAHVEVTIKDPAVKP